MFTRNIGFVLKVGNSERVVWSAMRSDTYGQVFAHKRSICTSPYSSQKAISSHELCRSEGKYACLSLAAE